MFIPSCDGSECQVRTQVVRMAVFFLMSRDRGNTGLHKKWGEESGSGERIRREKKGEGRWGRVTKGGDREE